MGRRGIQRATETFQERKSRSRGLDPVLKGLDNHDETVMRADAARLSERQAGEHSPLALRGKLRSRRVHSLWRVTFACLACNIRLASRDLKSNFWHALGPSGRGSYTGSRHR
jgi:hypothetical protein